MAYRPAAEGSPCGDGQVETTLEINKIDFRSIVKNSRKLLITILMIKLNNFQYCLNGKCVAEHENIIPDYTQNIPTYVRRDGTFNPTAHNRPLYAQYNNTEYR